MNLDFLKDAGSALLAISVVGLVGYATQIAVLGKDIERVADNIAEIKKELAENYDQQDAVRDAAEFKREIEILYGQLDNYTDRLNERINILDERITRASKVNLQ